MSVAIDSEMLYFSTIIAINVLISPIILYHIDIRQWRIVAVTPQNIAVFVSSLMCIGFSFVLTNSSMISRITLQLGFLAAAICFPTLEIMDLPGFGFALILPPMIAFTIITAGKYYLTRILCVSGIVDVLFFICINGICFPLSVTYFMNSIIVFNLGLCVSKLKKVWDLFNGDICTSLGYNGYIRLDRSLYSVDTLFSTASVPRALIFWNILMLSVCLVLLYIDSFDAH
jgi:hypothetical protein